MIEGLLDMMKDHRADYTNTFRAFTLNQPEATVLFDTSEFTEWLEQWRARLARQTEDSTAVQQLMKKSNPAVIPRNHRV
ncbi:hypothetical protein ACSNOI_48220, partial [Actinomadura kijaniata]|uniref:hypothetical protein n=1 Tax=Actinomadura kijaniata TaxID=46161 RepID=UPI003F1B099E